MLAFIARRLMVSVLVLFAATGVMFYFSTHVGDPLAEARQLQSEQAQQNRIAEITERMNLDEPWYVRYLLWLKGAVTGDLGVNRDGHSVNILLENAIAATLQLVVAAAVLAVVVGVAVGVISALRQYSGFDQSVTFAVFVCFSLPVFWVGTLLKQYVAIDLNNWLSSDPTLGVAVIAVISVLTAMAFSSVLVADRRVKLAVFFATGLGMAGLLAALSATGWFSDPGLGVVVVTLTAFDPTDLTIDFGFQVPCSGIIGDRAGTDVQHINGERPVAGLHIDRERRLTLTTTSEPVRRQPLDRRTTTDEPTPPMLSNDKTLGHQHAARTPRRHTTHVVLGHKPTLGRQLTTGSQPPSGDLTTPDSTT
jgi:ABC-type dipeptide/oligopeptide/nickel transport system permease subunit